MAMGLLFFMIKITNYMHIKHIEKMELKLL
jgi:hypothetical protein